MDAEMKKELGEIIEKNIPKQLGEALRKRLAELETKEARLKTAETQLDDMAREVTRQQGTISKLEGLGRSEKLLEQRARDLEKRETAMEVFELKVKLGAAGMANEKIIEFVHALMRNTEFRRNKFITNDLDYSPDGRVTKTPNGEATTETTD